MGFSFINKNSKLKMNEKTYILTGAALGTIVKSLEIITGQESCYVNIIREDGGGKEYANIKIDMKANDYLVLWEGFFVIPSGHKIYAKSDSSECTVVLNAVDVNGNAGP